VPDRIANKIVLAEDREQQNLVRRYLERCGHDTRNLRFEPLPAKTSGGSGEKYVRDHYAEQVRACRSSLGKKASALLIVIVDADSKTTAWRASQLSDELKAADVPALSDSEPIVVLIPKRHVETWIRALVGNAVDEVTDYKRPVPTPPEIRNAAAKLYNCTRPGANLPAGYPPSLADSIPKWQKIPS
jgi:hypothetical protein